MLALAAGIGAVRTTLYGGSIGPSEGAESQRGSNQEQAQSNASEAEHTADVAGIQNKVIEAFAGDHEKVTRYDNLMAE